MSTRIINEASDLALASIVVAPWEHMSALPVAVDALKQIGAELCVLRAALCEGSEDEGPLSQEIISRAITGIGERARVAAELVDRLSKRAAERGGAT